MDRNDLIYYSLKYEGEYTKIVKAIKRKEETSSVGSVSCITILDEEYPEEFLQLNEPPFVLYYKGDLRLLKEDKVAIVGSRNPGDYAKEATKQLVDHLKDDYVIVSGLAKGIDGLAQEEAKRTIGILGSGIDYLYPKENSSLILRCMEHQLVLSEYPGKVKPFRHHFPFRNRLIAALSKKIYVMEAGLQSGTMTSVKEALQLGKEVLCLPYRIFDQEGVGCNTLIEEGASMILLNEERR